MKKGDIASRRKLTAQVLILPTGTSAAYIDFGDLTGHKFATEVGRTPIMESKNGYRQKIAEIIDEVNGKYEFSLTEDLPAIMALSLLGSQGTDTTQSLVAAPSGTASISSALQGRSYRIGKTKVTTVVVTVSASTKIEGTDYSIDYVSGTIYIIPGGGIADAAAVTITFGCAAVTTHVFTANTTVYTTGTVVLIERDQHDTSNARETTFTGQYFISEREDHDTKKIAGRKLIIIPQTAETVYMRS
jgi:hypothetical protein